VLEKNPAGSSGLWPYSSDPKSAAANGVILMFSIDDRRQKTIFVSKPVIATNFSQKSEFQPMILRQTKGNDFIEVRKIPSPTFEDAVIKYWAMTGNQVIKYL